MARRQSAPIPVGLAGIGRAGWGMQCGEIDRCADKFKIVAACDIDPQRLKAMADRYGCATYRRFEDLAADNSVEVVSIATPSLEHVGQALSALQAGKKVFLEKPIALTLAGAKKLRAASRRHPGQLFIRHNRRFEGEFVHIRRILASGVLGKLYEVKLRRNSYARRDDWQTLIKCGGGQLLNWGPHIIDHGLQLMASPVADIWSDLKLIAARGDAEDHLKIVMTGDNGCVVDIEISGGAALGEPEWTLYGTRGALTCWAGRMHLKYLDPKGKLDRRRSRAKAPPMGGAFHQVGPAVLPKWIEQEMPVEGGCSTDDIWKYLHDSIRREKKFPITIDEAVAVMEVVEAVKKRTRFRALPIHRGR